MIDKPILTKREIESKISNVGDYVKIDFLARCLKSNIELETRRFVLLKLSELYEKLKMYYESARSVRNASELNPSDDGKMRDLFRAMELFIKSENYEDAEVSFTRALSYAKEILKPELRRNRIQVYKNMTEDFAKKGKWRNAITAYEKFIRITEISAEERKKAQQELLKIYEKIGKVSEYGSLKRSLEAPTIVPEAKLKEKNDDFDIDAFLGPMPEQKKKSFY